MLSMCSLLLSDVMTLPLETMLLLISISEVRCLTLSLPTINSGESTRMLGPSRRCKTLSGKLLKTLCLLALIMLGLVKTNRSTPLPRSLSNTLTCLLELCLLLLSVLGTLSWEILVSVLGLLINPSKMLWEISLSTLLTTRICLLVETVAGYELRPWEPTLKLSADWEFEGEALIITYKKMGFWC